MVTSFRPRICIVGLFLATFGLLACGTANIAETRAERREARRHAAQQPVMVPLPEITLAAKSVRCQEPLSLKLSVVGQKIVSAMAAGGACAGNDAASPRFYEFRQVATECGSLVYQGYVRGDSKYRLVLVDHTTRMCGDSKENVLEVKETGLDGKVRAYAGSFY